MTIPDYTKYSPYEPESPDISIHLDTGVDMSVGSKDWWFFGEMLETSVRAFLEGLAERGIVLSRPSSPARPSDPNEDT